MRARYALSGVLFLMLATATFAAAPTTTYVDCATGADSLTKALRAPMQPGDSLMLRRGCVWEGPATVTWSGVTVGAYGPSGDALPRIQLSAGNPATQVLTVTGDNNTLDSLMVRSDPPAVTSASDLCPGTGHGTPQTYARNGFVLTGSGNTLQNSKATELVDGVLLNGNRNRVLNNEIFNVNQDGALTVGGFDDYGAQAIEVNSSDNEIAGNYFHDNQVCSYDFGHDGSHLSLWAGTNFIVSRNWIHDNVAANSVNFAELGSSGGTIAGNIFERNVSVEASFLVSGTLNASSTGNRVSHNTIYARGKGSGGISCGSDCANVLSGGVRDNIIDTAEAQIWGAMPRSGNVLWGPAGVCVSSDQTSCGAVAPDLAADPMLSADHRIGLSSPAHGFASDGDSGAYQVAAAATATATLTPVPTVTPTPTRAPTIRPTPVCLVYTWQGKYVWVAKDASFCGR